MGFINTFKKKHPFVFEYQKATEVHHHDKFLNWMIIRFLPDWITPNGLSVFRIFGTPVVFLLILYDYLIIGVCLFLFFAFTDALDGSMARMQDKVTEFGTLIDPLADKLLIGSMVLLLVFEHFNFWLGIAILGLEIAFIVGAVYAKARFKTVRAANNWGKIKMILQVIAVFLTLMALLFNFQVLFTIAAGVFGLAVGFAILSLFTQGI